MFSRRRAITGSDRSLNLDHIPAVDAHCHGWRTGEILDKSPEGFLDRVTMLGMCLMSSGAQLSGEEIELLRRATATTPLALALARRLAALVGRPDDVPGGVAKRYERLRDSPLDHYRSLWDDARIEGLFVDDGYPLPSVDSEELAAETGMTVHRVARIEPMIDAARDQAADASELEDALTESLERAAAQGAVAFKSVIAYRTGLDVRAPSRAELKGAFSRWRDDGWASTRQHAKPVRDALLLRTLATAANLDRPVHIHCGGGDPDVVLAHARPQDLFPVLKDHRSQPVVLIHAGWPWNEEAAFIASVLPNVHLDISVMNPWASLAIDQKLEVLLGAAPTSQVLYGSDEASEPEVLWFAAHTARAALARVLGRAVEREWLTDEQGLSIGENVMGLNALRLHGVGNPA